MKVFSIVYVLVALTISMVTTFMQIQPALFFIEFLTGSDNKFSVNGAIALTMLTFLIPLLIILLIAKAMNKNKNIMPDLFGRTGIVIHRKKSLSNAIHDSHVLIDGEYKSSVSNGKSTFIETGYGKFTVQIKSHKAATLDVDVPRGKIINLQMSFVDNGRLKVDVELEKIEEMETIIA